MKSALQIAVEALTLKELTEGEERMVKVKMKHLEDLLKEWDETLYEVYQDVVEGYVTAILDHRERS